MLFIAHERYTILTISVDINPFMVYNYTMLELHSCITVISEK